MREEENSKLITLENNLKKFKFSTFFTVKKSNLMMVPLMRVIILMSQECDLKKSRDKIKWQEIMKKKKIQLTPWIYFNI